MSLFTDKGHLAELQRDKWLSDVYKHFEKAQLVEEPGKEPYYKFVCKAKYVLFNAPCGSLILPLPYSPNAVPLTRVRWDTSTGNLNRHLNQCKAKVAPAGQGINDFAHGSTYSKAKFRLLCSLWVARHHRPYTIIQDEELLAIFRMLYGRVEVPHPTTLSRDVREVYVMTQLTIARKLQVRRLRSTS